jgi:hypothetical protein
VNGFKSSIFQGVTVTLVKNTCHASFYPTFITG